MYVPVDDRTRWSPRATIAGAAIAALLKRQKPIPRSAVAWWPGGRATTNAASASPPVSRSIATEPTPRGGGHRRRIPSATTVSTSSIPPTSARLGERLDVPLVVHDYSAFVACGRLTRSVVELRVGHSRDRGLDAGGAFGVCPAGVVHVGTARDDDDSASPSVGRPAFSWRRDGDDSRRSMTRGMSRRRPNRRPASIRPARGRRAPRLDEDPATRAVAPPKYATRRGRPRGARGSRE